MSLSDLPRELLLNIALYLDEPEMNALCRTNRGVYDLLNTDLYRRNMTKKSGPSPQGRSLLWGAKNGVKATVQRAIAAGRRRHVGPPLPEYYQSALIATVQEGYTHLVKLLLEVNGIDLNRWWPENPLTLAAKEGHSAIVELLLAAVDINPNAIHRRSSFGYSALHWACQNGDTSTVNLLLAKDGIDINLRHPYTGNTPLMQAANTGSVSVMESLLARDDLDPNIMNSWGDRALYPSLRLGCTIVKSLLNHPKIDPNLEVHLNQTGLMCACEIGDLDIVKLFLDREDIDVNRQDYISGETALDLAIIFGKLEAIKLLLDRDDLDLNNSNNRYRWTPLHWACFYRNLPAVDLLLKRKDVDPNAKNYRGSTPLAYASCWRQSPPHDELDFVHLLFTHPDIDPNPVDSNGFHMLENVINHYKYPSQYRRELECLLRDHGAT
ncbi:Ankyrin repeat-containing domain protein [Elaphomyces granulatus]